MKYRAKIKLTGPEVQLASRFEYQMYPGIAWGVVERVLLWWDVFGAVYDSPKSVRR